ncbi:unnamed protein product [Amoebophrya sp. A25]|nr:unnamed protein product [Amoebophrya sp. A25]|eukprot:GSA25T00014599001.1
MKRGLDHIAKPESGSRKSIPPPRLSSTPKSGCVTADEKSDNAGTKDDAGDSSPHGNVTGPAEPEPKCASALRCTDVPQEALHDDYLSDDEEAVETLALSRREDHESFVKFQQLETFLQSLYQEDERSLCEEPVLNTLKGWKKCFKKFRVLACTKAVPELDFDLKQNSVIGFMGYISGLMNLPQLGSASEASTRDAARPLVKKLRSHGLLNDNGSNFQEAVFALFLKLFPKDLSGAIQFLHQRQMQTRNRLFVEGVEGTEGDGQGGSGEEVFPAPGGRGSIVSSSVSSQSTTANLFPSNKKGLVNFKSDRERVKNFSKKLRQYKGFEAFALQVLGLDRPNFYRDALRRLLPEVQALQNIHDNVGSCPRCRRVPGKKSASDECQDSYCVPKCQDPYGDGTAWWSIGDRLFVGLIVRRYLDNLPRHLHDYPSFSDDGPTEAQINRCRELQHAAESALQSYAIRFLKNDSVAQSNVRMKKIPLEDLLWLHLLNVFDFVASDAKKVFTMWRSLDVDALGKGGAHVGALSRLHRAVNDHSVQGVRQTLDAIATQERSNDDASRRRFGALLNYRSHYEESAHELAEKWQNWYEIEGEWTGWRQAMTQICILLEEATESVKSLATFLAWRTRNQNHGRSTLGGA